MKMRRISRLLMLTLLVATTVVAGANPATAAPPANDAVASATVVPGVPYTDSVDTTDATFATGDTCGLATVWYRFTATTDGPVEFNTRGSDFETTLALYTGEPGNLVLVECRQNEAGFHDVYSRIVLQAEAGTTYYIEAGTCCGVGEPGQVGPGGALTFNVEEPAPAVSEVTVTLSGRGTVSPEGKATLRGTIACDQPALYDMTVELTQQFGRLVASGFTFIVASDCGSEPVPWSVDIYSGTLVLLSGGRATANVFATGYNAEGQASDELTGQTVKLRPVRR